MGRKHYAGVSKGYKGRNLDMELLTPMRAYQDGIAMDIQDSLQSLRVSEFTNKPAMRVPCPVCEFQTGIILVDREGPQDRKCTNCLNESIFVKTVFGNWKIKSILGNEFVSDKKRVFRKKVV